VYAAAGIASIAQLDNALSVASGVLLISASVFVLWKRRTYRQDLKRMESDARVTERRAAIRRTKDRCDRERWDAERWDTERMEADRREVARRELDRRKADRSKPV
jgi:hypothetical protein